MIIEIAANAISNFLLSLFIFLHVNFKRHFINQGSIESICAIHPSEWITEQFFTI